MGYGPNVHPEIVDSFREGYLWDDIQQTDPELASNISAQDSCLVLRGTFQDPKTLDYLRNTIGLATHFLDNGGVGIYDPQAFQYWSPAQWRQNIFTPAAPVPRKQTIILLSEDEDKTLWIHTRGMLKFGRPDISIAGVQPDQRDGFVELCNRLIEFQAFGGVVSEGQRIQLGSVPDGLRCYHRGDMDDVDFNNVHIAIE